MAVSTQVEPEEAAVVRGEVYCNICDTHIPPALWPLHDKSRNHIRKENFAVFKAALDEAEKNKHGVTVSTNSDFGILEVTEATASVPKVLLVETTIPSSRIRIVDVKLASSDAGPGTSPSSCVSFSIALDLG
jgi:helicase MOV-10